MTKVSMFNCPNCGSQHGAVRFKMEIWEMVGCCECDAEMFWPIPSEAELTAYYTRDTSYDVRSRGVAESYLQDPSGWRNHAINFATNRAGLGLVPGACYLDVGCSYGFQAIELNKLGFETLAVEYSADAVAFINAHGGRGYCGSVLDEQLPVRHVDYCYSSNALEHMGNPYDVLKRIRELLRPGGTLELDLPHWGSLVASIPGRRWKWLVPRDHIHYFRAKTLPKILESMGFKIVAVTTTADPQEIIEVFEAFDVAQDLRTVEATRTIAAILKNGRLGHQLNIVARVSD